MISKIFVNKKIAQVCLIITTAIWGITFIMVKEALNDAPPYAFAAWRFLIASICNFFFIFFQFKSFTKIELIGGVLCGILLHAGYAFQNYGLQLTSASNSAFITGTSILVVPFILWVYQDKKIQLRAWLAIIIALIGLFLLINPDGNDINLGDIITIGCSIAFAGHIVIQDNYMKKNTSILRFFFIQLLTVTILSYGSYLAIDTKPIVWSERLITAILITGILATFVAIGIMVWAQKLLSPTHTAVIFALEPVFAALYAWYAANEILSITSWIGGILIIIGVISTEISDE